MRITVYNIFLPSPTLIEAAKEAQEDWLAEPAVWIDYEYDRTGRYSSETVEQAFWTVFLAKLVCDGVESSTQRRFRERCLELGFKGCWWLHLAANGGFAHELIDEAREAGPFADRARSM